MTAVDLLPVASAYVANSQENVAVVRSVYAAFNALAQGGGTDAYVAEHFDLECEYSPVEEANTIRGHEALIRWIGRWLDAWDDAWDEVDEITASGEHVLAATRVHGRGRHSGMVISQRLFDVFEIRDGRVLRIREYLDRDEALEAARPSILCEDPHSMPGPIAPCPPASTSRSPASSTVPAEVLGPTSYFSTRISFLLTNSSIP